MRRVLILTAVIVAMFAVAASAADKYMVDSGHSTVEFGVKHMVVTTVKGKFGEYAGHAMFDQDDPTKSTVEVTIKTASVDTDHGDRDDHLRGDDFFSAEKYPEIHFKSTKIVKDGDDYVAHGKLTIRDVTKDVEIEFELNGPIVDPWGNSRIGIEGELKLNRKEYGLAFDNTLANGGLVVGDEVKIELNIEFVKVKQEG
jgi:polyisoprenoid-binding protein YceI